MEAEVRPGHFDGVGTIVKRLLKLYSPPMRIWRKRFSTITDHQKNGNQTTPCMSLAALF
jgi:hypothetical protein